MKKRTDRLTVVVNNSGATWYVPPSAYALVRRLTEGGRGGPYDDFPETGWDKLMALNVKSIFYGMISVFLVGAWLMNCTVTVGLHGLLTKGATADTPSRVINIASMAAIQTTDVTTGDEGGLSAPGHGTFSYGPSKAACVHLSRMQSSKLAPHNIMVNCICP